MAHHDRLFDGWSVSTWLWLLCLWLVAAATAQQPNSIHFSEHLIADKYAYAYGIAAADFDRDGDLDLTSADYTPHNMLYLFENGGRGGKLCSCC